MNDIKTHINGTTGGPVRVYVRGGRIIRITPIELNHADATSWKIHAMGRTFIPQRKTTLAPYTSAWRSIG